MLSINDIEAFSPPKTSITLTVMTALVIFPTIENIFNAGYFCHANNLEIAESYITARDKTYETIARVISSGRYKNILVLSPFKHNKIDSNIIWPDEKETQSVNDPDIEKYLKYKKVLTFLGDNNGELATSHLTEAVNHLGRRPDKAPEEDKAVRTSFAEKDFPAIEGRSHKMRCLKKEIHRIAGSGIDRVLLLGETGTGKEAVSFFLHALDPLRKNKKFGSVNCATLREDFLISELFGHEKGSFTGAYQKRDGLISKLNGGTLFLDEIPELPPKAQAMLLRFLENGSYTALGSNQPQKADLKIIAAGQSSVLQEKLQVKSFRQDLYFRLNGKTVNLPSLSEIAEDIPTLVVHLAYRIEQNDSKKRDAAISYFFDRMAELQAHLWPGNVRELANYVARRIKLGEDEHIDLHEFVSILRPENVEFSEKNSHLTAITTPSQIEIRHPNQVETLETIKTRYVKHVNALLREKGFNQRQICKKLAITTNTLKKMI